MAPPPDVPPPDAPPPSEPPKKVKKVKKKDKEGDEGGGEKVKKVKKKTSAPTGAPPPDAPPPDAPPPPGPPGGVAEESAVVKKKVKKKKKTEGEEGEDGGAGDDLDYSKVKKKVKKKKATTSGPPPMAPPALTGDVPMGGPPAGPPPGDAPPPSAAPRSAVKKKVKKVKKGEGEKKKKTHKKGEAPSGPASPERKTKKKVKKTEGETVSTLLSRTMDPKETAKLNKRLNGMGFSDETWMGPQVNAGGDADKVALAAAVAYDPESNATKAAAGKLAVPLEWVVDVADPNNDVDWYIGTAYAYIQDGDGVATIDVSIPDREEPKWQGEVPLTPQSIHLIECCDEGSRALYYAGLREHVTQVDWKVEWLEETADGDHAWVAGNAKWFNRLSNQILVVKGEGAGVEEEKAGAVEGPMVPVRVDESLKLVEANASQLGVEEFEALVVDGIVQWADPDAGTGPASAAAEPTPQELLRSQLELLRHYEEQMLQAMDSAESERDRALEEQKVVMEQLKKFVFEGDLMQGHEVMATLDAEHIPEPGKLSAAQVFDTVQRIEDDLWHVMEGSVLGAKTNQFRFETGARVRVVFRNGALWEPGVVESLCNDGTYNIVCDADGEVLDGIPLEYIEPEMLEDGGLPAGIASTMPAQLESQTPEWLESEKAMLRQELEDRIAARNELGKFVDHLEATRARAPPPAAAGGSRGPPAGGPGSTPAKADTGTPAKAGPDGGAWEWDGAGEPQRGQAVGLRFSNGLFVGTVLRVYRPEPDDHEGIPLFDIGFDNYVERAVPLDRLQSPAPPPMPPAPPLSAQQQLRVVACTFNMANSEIPDADIDQWLPRGGRLRDLGDGNNPEPADVIVIALQESAYPPRGWEGGVGADGEAVDEKALLKASGQDLQDQFFQVLGPDFRLVGFVQRRRQRLLVYLRAVLLPASGVAAIETESAGVDLSAGGGGKGGLVFKLRLQDTNLCFVALQLGDDDSEEGSLERHTVVEQVLARARVGYKSLDAASQFHHCIAIGHLPYRVHLVKPEGVNATDELPADTATVECDEVMKLVAEGAAGWTKIWEQGDELRRALMQQEVLNGFITPDCNFAPTSRLKVPREPVLARGAGPAAEDYEHELASGAQVTPHYACRALVKSLPGCASAIVCREYRPTLNLRSSPHVPLRAAFVLSPAASPPLPLALQEGGGGNEEDIMMITLKLSLLQGKNLGAGERAEDGGSAPWKTEPKVRVVVRSDPSFFMADKTLEGATEAETSLNPEFRTPATLRLRVRRPLDSDMLPLELQQTAMQASLAGMHLILTVVATDPSIVAAEGGSEEAAQVIVGSFALSVDRLLESQAWKEKKLAQFHENLTRNGKLNGRLSGCVEVADITTATGAPLKQSKGCVVS